MGGSSSKSKSEVFQELVNEAFLKNLQQCSVTSSTSQSITIVGNRNRLSNIEMRQLFSSLLTCTQDSKFVGDFQARLANDIKQAAESQSVAVLGVLGKSSSEVESSIHNSVRNSITSENLTKLVRTIEQTQTINITGNDNTLTDITMEQITKSISTNSQSLTAEMSAVTDIKNALEQEAKSKQEDPIQNFMNALANLASGPLMMIMIIIIVIVVGAIGIFYMFSTSSNPMLTGEQPKTN